MQEHETPLQHDDTGSDLFAQFEAAVAGARRSSVTEELAKQLIQPSLAPLFVSDLAASDVGDVVEQTKEQSVAPGTTTAGTSWSG